MAAAVTWEREMGTVSRPTPHMVLNTSKSRRPNDGTTYNYDTIMVLNAKLFIFLHTIHENVMLLFVPVMLVPPTLCLPSLAT